MEHKEEIFTICIWGFNSIAAVVYLLFVDNAYAIVILSVITIAGIISIGKQFEAINKKNEKKEDRPYIEKKVREYIKE